MGQSSSQVSAPPVEAKQSAGHPSVNTAPSSHLQAIDTSLQDVTAVDDVFTPIDDFDNDLEYLGRWHTRDDSEEKEERPVNEGRHKFGAEWRYKTRYNIPVWNHAVLKELRDMDEEQLVELVYDAFKFGSRNVKKFMVESARMRHHNNTVKVNVRSKPKDIEKAPEFNEEECSEYIEKNVNVNVETFSIKLPEVFMRDLKINHPEDKFETIATLVECNAERYGFTIKEPYDLIDIEWKEGNNVKVRNVRNERKCDAFLKFRLVDHANEALQNGIRIRDKSYSGIRDPPPTPPIICRRCSLFDHSTDTCRESIPRCCWCAGVHEIRRCPSKAIPGQQKCVNCDGDHPATDPNCLVAQYEQQRLVQSRKLYPSSLAPQSDDIDHLQLARDARDLVADLELSDEERRANPPEGFLGRPNRLVMGASRGFPPREKDGDIFDDLSSTDENPWPPGPTNNPKIPLAQSKPLASDPGPSLRDIRDLNSNNLSQRSLLNNNEQTEQPRLPKLPDNRARSTFNSHMYSDGCRGSSSSLSIMDNFVRRGSAQFSNPAFSGQPSLRSSTSATTQPGTAAATALSTTQLGKRPLSASHDLPSTDALPWRTLKNPAVTSQNKRGRLEVSKRRQDRGKLLCMSALPSNTGAAGPSNNALAGGATRVR